MTPRRAPSLAPLPRGLTVLATAALALSAPGCAAPPAPADAVPDTRADAAPPPLDALALDALALDAPLAPADVPASPDALADVPVPPPRRFDWVGIIGTGQSLSVGAASGPSLSTTQTRGNLVLVDRGSEPRYDGTGDVLALAPLVEPVRPALAGYPAIVYPNNIAGETPHTAMANQVTDLAAAVGLPNYVSVHSVVGESGRSITAIARGGTGRAFAASLYEVTAINAMAVAQRRRYGVAAVVLTHGESDATRATYAADIRRLQQDYDREVRVITRQSEHVVLLLSQQSTVPAMGALLSTSMIAAWRLGVDHPGEIVCTGPKYQYQYAADLIHLDANNYRRLGIKYAEVFHRVVVLGEPWRPLQPRAARRAGRVITVDFDVPVPPLTWDENIPPPHQAQFTEWARGRGFEVLDAAGRVPITAVEIAGADAVRITLGRDPAAMGLTVRYAMVQDTDGLAGGPTTGRRGMLRDSDPFVGYDAARFMARVTAGSPEVTAVDPAALAGHGARDVVTGAGLAGETIVRARVANRLTLSRPWAGATGTAELSVHSDQHNYCVHFAMPVAP